VCLGLRKSETIGLQWEDIDLENNKLQVVEKGDKYRVIEFGDNLKQQLEDYIEERNKYYGNVNTNALFVSQKKQRISNNTIRELLGKYADGVTDKHVSAHTLRRTSANLLYNKTGDIYLVGNHLGHADISTTKRYISVDEERQKRKVEFMDSVI
jgi:site-specific recombinase XerD